MKMFLAAMLAVVIAASSAMAQCQGGCNKGGSSGGGNVTQSDLTDNQQSENQLRERVQALRAEVANLQTSADTLRALKAQRDVLVMQKQRALQLKDLTAERDALVADDSPSIQDASIVRVGRSDPQVRVQPIQLIKPLTLPPAVQPRQVQTRTQPQLRQQASGGRWSR